MELIGTDSTSNLPMLFSHHVQEKVLFINMICYFTFRLYHTRSCLSIMVGQNYALKYIYLDNV